MTAWTPDEDALLREHWPTTHVRVIAKQLGRTTNAVIGRAHRLGLERIPRERIYARIAETVRARNAGEQL